MTQEIQKQVEKEARALEGVLDDVRKFPVDTQDDLDFAKHAVLDTKAQLKRLENRRKSATGPMNAAIKEINSWFKPATEALKAIETTWKGKILQAQKDFAAKTRLLEVQAREAAEAGDLEGVREAMVKASDAIPDMSGIVTRKVWKFEIEHPNLLPPRYLVPDEAAIRAEVQRLKGECDIPGLRVWCEDSVAARGTR